MRRLSFRQSLLLGFLLISTLLGAAAWRGLNILDRFAVESRAGAMRAVQMTADIHQLAERSVDLERSARQYLVLREPELQARFASNLSRARQGLERIAAVDDASFQGSVDAWRAAADAATVAFAADDGDATLAALARIGVLNAALADKGRLWIDAHNARLLDELERNRRTLTVQVVGAIAAALMVALIIAWWLVRPVAALESAIEQLGTGQFDAEVSIRGPDDLQRLGRRLDWLRLRLSALEADRVRVLRHVSHELKTPLAAMREGVSLLKEQVAGPLTEDQREVARILEHNSRALQRQIEDLLNYHATVFDAGHLRRSRVWLDELMRSVADAQTLQAQARGLQVTVDAERQQAFCDAEKLRVALGNLLSNAIIYSPEGGRICLCARLEGDLVLLDCADEGPGVAAADVDRIFEPFVQGRRRPSWAPPGSGVGLSIVRELVGAQGGRVFLLAAPRGAHFRVELPYEP